MTTSCLIKSLLFLFLLVMVGGVVCSVFPHVEPLENYSVNGEVVRCRQASMHSCGVSLWQCEYGRTFYCVTNIEELPDK